MSHLYMYMYMYMYEPPVLKVVKELHVYMYIANVCQLCDAM